MTVLLVWIYNTYVAPDRPLDAATAAALATIIGSFVAYWTPSSPDQIVLPGSQAALPDDTSKVR